MAIIYKSTNNKCWRGCGEERALLHCWWECKLVQPPWKTLCRYLRKLYTELACDPAIPLLGIYPDKTFLEIGTCTCYVHHSPIHTSQDMETTWTSTNKWMDSEDVAWIHNRIRLNHRKNKIMPFSAMWMELETLLLSELSQKERQTPDDITYI